MKQEFEVFADLKARFSACKPQTIVITGANSGIGLQAAKYLIKLNPQHRLILVCRTEQASKKAVDLVTSELDDTDGKASTSLIIPMACDHTRLESVRAFTEELRSILVQTHDSNKWKVNGIDVLCLNAAVLRPKDSPVLFTGDGLEVTFQTNALSPFLIAYLTQKLMNPGGRVIVSTSGLYTHTKLCTKGMIDAHTGRARKGFEMIDGSEFHFKRSYALSKVCDVALTLCLKQRLAHKHVTANCFSPGLMMTSGLFRYQTKHDMQNALAHSKFVRMNEKSVPWGGGALVYMALSKEAGELNGMYWGDTDSRKGDDAVYGKEFAPSPISEESMPRECTEELWRLCCELSDVLNENDVLN